MVFSTLAAAQRSRPSVSAAEVTGTFKHAFGGKFKGSSSDIKILSIGKGKLRVTFDLTYPFVDGTGELSANVGQADGEAAIAADTAIFTSSEYGEGECRIKIRFVKPGIISVSQEGESTGCGFGFNVSADGTYRKTSSKKPKFDRE
jgi:hypothetical protein